MLFLKSPENWVNSGVPYHILITPNYSYLWHHTLQPGITKWRVNNTPVSSSHFLCYHNAVISRFIISVPLTLPLPPTLIKTPLNDRNPKMYRHDIKYPDSGMLLLCNPMRLHYTLSLKDTFCDILHFYNCQQISIKHQNHQYVCVALNTQPEAHLKGL